MKNYFLLGILISFHSYGQILETNPDAMMIRMRAEAAAVEAKQHVESEKAKVAEVREAAAEKRAKVEEVRAEMEAKRRLKNEPTE